ncbi:MAG: ribbon-helix-helix domain-containing protein [Candidatus Njordarchaeales archaeon]
MSMITVSFKIPKQILERVDHLVRLGIFSSRSEFFRDAIRLHLQRFEKYIRRGEIDRLIYDRLVAQEE